MKALSIRGSSSRVLVAPGIILAVLLAAPALVVLALLARFALVPVLVIAVVTGVVLHLTSRRFRAWFQCVTENEISYRGLRLATDVEVAPVHTWVRGEGDSMLVGTDDLAPTVLGPVATVELPQAGQRFRAGEPLVRLRRGSRTVVLRAPLGGTVMSRNLTLYQRPELVNEDPFGAGWLVRLSKERREEVAGWLCHGARAGLCFRSEVDRLVTALRRRHQPVPGPANGSPLSSQAYRDIDEFTWRELSEGFFAGQTAAVAP